MRMIFKKAIPRRAFLHGVGTTIALPLLEAMVPAFGGPAAEPVTRLAFIYGPNGRIMNLWTPPTEGAAFEMTPTLEPLTPFRDQLLVLSGLDVKAADARGNEGGGVHARPCAAYLTGIHPKPNSAVGISADQLAARELSKYTQLGSLEITLESSDIVGVSDGQYRDSYLKTISWRSPTTPLPMEHNPRKVFERLLGEEGSTDPAERRSLVQKQRSVLDSVTEGVSRLLAALAPGDRGKLTEYLDSIRDIERRIQLAEEQTSRALPDVKRPAGIPPTYSENAKLMLDLITLAFQADLTRVVTFMWSQEQGAGDYRELGISEGHHASSHHGGRRELIENCIKIDALHSRLFAYFLEKMRSTSDGDGSLLDHSSLLYGSSLSDGMGHIHHDVPTLLLGRGGGKIKGGRHLRFGDVPFSNLLLTLLDITGVSAEGFLDPEYSDTTGKLDLTIL